MVYNYKFCDKKHYNYEINLKPVFEKRKDWKKTHNYKNAGYTNCPEYTKIIDPYYGTLSFFNNKKYLLTKSLRNYYPESFLIQNGMIQKNSCEFQHTGRWFLKPSNGYGGTGIEVLDKIEDYKKYVKSNRKYIVQKEIIPKLINGRKFDLRMYMVIVFQRGINYFFLNQNGFTRICNAPYTQGKRDKKSNITNVCFGVDTMDIESLRKNYLLINGLDFYSEAMPRINQMMTLVATEINNDFHHKTTGFTFIGLDIILDQDNNPYILELNNKVGFKTNKFSKVIKNYHYEIWFRLR